MIIFDTDVLSALMATRQPPPTTLTDRIADTDPDDHATTTITLGEIAYGAFRVERPELYERARELITAGGMTVLAFDQPAAEHYGAIRTASNGRAPTRIFASPPWPALAARSSLPATFATSLASLTCAPRTGSTPESQLLRQSHQTLDRDQGD